MGQKPRGCCPALASCIINNCSINSGERSIHLCDKAGGRDRLRFSFSGTFITYHPLPAALSHQCSHPVTWKPVLRRSRRSLSRAEPEDGVLPGCSGTQSGFRAPVMWVPQALCPGHSGGSREVPHPRIWWNIPADCTAAISTFSRLCLGQLQAHEREVDKFPVPST